MEPSNPKDSSPPIDDGTPQEDVAGVESAMLKQQLEYSDEDEQGAVGENSDFSNISSDDAGEKDNAEIIALAEKEIPKLKVSPPPTCQHQGKEDQQPIIKSSSDSLNKSERELKNLCTNMFAKLEDYLKDEVASSVEDYALLERMNQAATSKYQDMLKVATSVSQAMYEVNHKFSDLKPYLDQIEQIEHEVVALEQAAYTLDGYAKRLEERFRKLEKR